MDLLVPENPLYLLNADAAWENKTKPVYEKKLTEMSAASHFCLNHSLVIQKFSSQAND